MAWPQLSPPTTAAGNMISTVPASTRSPTQTWHRPQRGHTRDQASFPRPQKARGQLTANRRRRVGQEVMMWLWCMGGICVTEVATLCFNAADARDDKHPPTNALFCTVWNYLGATLLLIVQSCMHNNHVCWTTNFSSDSEWTSINHHSNRVIALCAKCLTKIVLG